MLHYSSAIRYDPGEPGWPEPEGIDGEKTGYKTGRS